MNYKFEDIGIIIAEGNPDVRRSIRSILQINGFRNISDVGTLRETVDLIKGGDIDLVMVDFELPGGDPCNVIRDVREERLGDNPFLPFILIAETISEKNVRKVVDSGVDHVLKRPISTGDLLGRVRELIENRKPFVVTQTYVGPDRRSKGRSDPIRDKLVAAPNKIRAKAHGDKKALARIEMELQRGKKAIKTVRVQRYGVAILTKVNELVANVKAGNSENTAQLVSDSIDLMAEASQNLEGTRYEDNASEIFMALRQILCSIQDRGRLNKQDSTILMPISVSLAKIFVDAETVETP